MTPKKKYGPYTLRYRRTNGTWLYVFTDQQTGLKQISEGYPSKAMAQAAAQELGKMYHDHNQLRREK